MVAYHHVHTISFREDLKKLWKLWSFVYAENYTLYMVQKCISFVSASYHIALFLIWIKVYKVAYH